MTLKNVLLINAVSSGVTGILLALTPGFFATLFNVNTTFPFTAVGIFLIIFSLFVLTNAFRDPIQNLRLQTANQSNLTVRWDQTSGGPFATTYRIQYRQHKNRSSNEWYQLETTDQWKAIPMLKADTEYEVQVRAEQFFQQSAYSEPRIFRTLPLAPTNLFVAMMLLRHRYLPLQHHCST